MTTRNEAADAPSETAAAISESKPLMSIVDSPVNFRESLAAERQRIGNSIPSAFQLPSFERALAGNKFDNMLAMAGDAKDGAQVNDSKPALSLPQAIKDTPPSSVKQEGDVTIRHWDKSGYEHRQYKNGAEALLDSKGRVVSVLDSKECSGKEHWARSEVKFEYSSKPGQENVVAKATFLDYDSGKQQITREAGKNGVVSITPSADKKHPGYSIESRRDTFDRKAVKTGWEQTTEISELGLKSTELRNFYGADGKLKADVSGKSVSELITKDQKSPDGKSTIPAGSLTRTFTIDAAGGVEVCFPKSDERSFSIYIQQDKNAPMELASESYKKAIAYKVPGNIPVGKDIEGLEKQRDGSYVAKDIIGFERSSDGITLLREKKGQEGVRLPAMILHTDAKGRVTGVDKKTSFDLR